MTLLKNRSIWYGSAGVGHGVELVCVDLRHGAMTGNIIFYILYNGRRHSGRQEYSGAWHREYTF
jgi:hypothetical protein